MGGLVVFGIRAVVADLGSGQNDNLSRVRRVGENFLVAGDGSIKNDFAVALAFGAVAFASEDSPVFQRKDSLHSRSGVWISKILSGNRAAAKHRTWTWRRNSCRQKAQSGGTSVERR